MIKHKLSEDAILYYNTEIEQLMVAIQILCGRDSEMLQEVYTKEEIESWQRRYTFLFEVFSDISPNVMMGVLDVYLKSAEIEDFSLELLKEILCKEREGALVSCMLEGEDELETIRLAQTDGGLRKLYDIEENQRSFASFLAMRALYRNTDELFEELVDFARALKTAKFIEETQLAEQEAERECEVLKERLASNADPLAVSEAIMRKTFYHRGPYEKYVFIPTRFGVFRTVRYYDSPNQVLIYRPGKIGMDKAVLLGQLKAIADETRIDIIKLLNRRGPMCGKDIAEAFSLAPSTVSHHMEQLRNAGVLHEEPDKKSRYYSVREGCREDFIQLIEEIFEK